MEVREGAKVAVEPGNTVTLGRRAGRRSTSIVGADGANGTTARALGLGEGIVHGVAYEGNVPYGDVSP